MNKVTVAIVLDLLLFLKCYGENVDWHKNFDYYEFYPEIGKCYEMYDQYEKVTPFICQRPANPEKQSCIELIKREQYCLGIKTPTNETIELFCKDSEGDLSYLYDDELKTCFNISGPDENYKEVCQQIFDDYSVGITTPDNFTILFDSYFCSTSMTDTERMSYSNFIDTFLFDPEIKKCYKIYNKHQQISPFTCLNEEVFTSCVNDLPHIRNCEGIITQNNETVVLHCSDDKETLPDRNCFKIYTANNSLHIACQNKVEERCVGITTPTNLTVLLDCYFCIKPGVRYIPEDVERRRSTWKFVTSYLSKEVLGNNSYLGKLDFKASQGIDADFFEYSKKISTVYNHWLPNSNCYGITLESNETIILGCLSKQILKNIRSGCFVVINPEMKQQIVCSKIMDEACVGITSPLKWSIALACYSAHYKNAPDIEKESYNQNPLDNYLLFLRPNNYYEIHPSHEIDSHSCTKSANPKNYARVHWIPGEKRCLGLTTPANETIEFGCENSNDEEDEFYYFSTRKTCFNLYKSTNRSEEVCLQKFGNFSVGLTTPSNYSVLLNSFFCTAFKTLQEILEYKEFIDNFAFDPSIRSCYKVFTPDQDISPYTCLSNDVYDACIHVLENTTCMGITTQNNEIVILECLNGTNVVNGTGCFKIYSSDNQMHIACQKQVEERCIGVITPSNLTVLLECHTCISVKGGSRLPTYSDNYRKTYRQLVEYYLYMFTQKNYALEDEMYLRGYTPEQDIKILDCYSEINRYAIHILHDHERCRGIRMDNLETIVLGCPNKKSEKAGCFDVFRPIYNDDNKIISPDVKVGNVCVKILNEWCVGITTPQNWTVPLSCFYPPAAVCGVVTAPDNGPPMA